MCYRVFSKDFGKAREGVAEVKATPTESIAAAAVAPVRRADQEVFARFLARLSHWRAAVESKPEELV